MAHIWVVTDGKPGHQNQSLGLTDALGRLVAGIQVHLVPAHKALSAGCACLLGAAKWVDASLPSPDLIVTTGHRTHLTALAYKRHFKVPLVVLMKPSLPLAWFDLCLMPHHDNPPVSKQVERSVESASVESSCVEGTYGALNRMDASAFSHLKEKPGKPMILLGGPSKHAVWDEARVLAQVTEICASYREILVTTSRRTPASTLRAIEQLGLAHLEIVPFEQTDANWLKHHLPRSPDTWVSIDSVSMIYEALTAQSRVGIIELEPMGKTPSRVLRGVHALYDKGLVTPFSEFAKTSQMVNAGQVFNEAERCAAIVKERFL